MSYLNGLVVSPAFFNLSLNLAIKSSWSQPQSSPGLVFADCIGLLNLGCKECNQADFDVHHLVMSMCIVFSCVVGRGYLLWSVHSLCKTLLVFALLQRLTELCEETALVIVNTSSNNTRDNSIHMDITRWSILKSDWLYSLQLKMEKLYTVSKKQDQELTMAQIMKSLLQNSDLNWRK